MDYQMKFKIHEGEGNVVQDNSASNTKAQEN